MGLGRTLRTLLGRATNTHIYRVLPRGVDLAHDLARSMPAYRVDHIFDVGANLGQSARRFLQSYPDARIYCFEPVSETYRKLQASLEANRRVGLYRLAFGSVERRGQMILQGRPDMFYLRDASRVTPVEQNAQTEEVEVTTLDEFCRSHRINEISYLKIDTEGGDLEVLKGATGMLNEQRIDLVEVEAGMSSTNKHHVPFEVLKGFLESRQYFLFGIYEQVREWPTKEPHLRRTNPVFISRRMIDAHRGGT